MNEATDDKPEHIDLYEHGIYLRGLFIQRYAGVEFALTFLLASARHHPAYHPLGDLPFKFGSKISRLEKLITTDGPLLPYADELRDMIVHFNKVEEERHFFAHGLMAMRGSGDNTIFAFRLYDHKNGIVHAGTLEMTLSQLEQAADYLSPISARFTGLVSKLVSDHFNPKS